MIFKETKFAYRHKPTNKWCYIYKSTSFLGGEIFNHVTLDFITEFDSSILYNARNVIEEDLMRSIMKGEKYAALNFFEFELVEIEIEYKIKQ
jgi:hypothetical protein